MFSPTDFAHMQRALALAARGLYTTDPNPRVGCVLVKDGAVIGEGFTQPAGQDHAEIQALKDARVRGNDPCDATAYVTLEPCSHFGRTPPCANALIDARIACVIAALEDPNPLVSGRGLALLRAAGIDVRSGLLAAQAREMNIGFVSRMTRQRPWVRMKIAASLDARTGLPSGESQWITSAVARNDGHAWRARASAILTGIGTVKQDDPRMIVRATDIPDLPSVPRQPLRVLVDSRLDVSPDAQIFAGGAPTLVFCAAPNTSGDASDNARDIDIHDVRDAHDTRDIRNTRNTRAMSRTERAQALRARGAELVALGNERGKVDLPAMLTELAARGVNELHVEAGYRLNGSLLREGCVDELLVYVAPSLLGNNAIGMIDLAAPATLAARTRLVFHSVDLIGDDLRILARFAA